ncbi:MAG: hypothetical protein K2X72_37245 [Reyranella sp.]|nr:hypothetical protein [Reyranella sp.]
MILVAGLVVFLLLILALWLLSLPANKPAYARPVFYLTLAVAALIAGFIYRSV